MTRLVRVLLLLTVWLALWADLSLANVASGLALACAIVVGFDTWREGTVVVRPIHATRFALYFVYKLVESSLVVARVVVSREGSVYTGIVAVQLGGCSDAVATLVADTISLTPGTLTVEVRQDPLTLFVHALDLRNVEQVEADVRQLEVLAIRAFGSPEAIAALDTATTRSWRAR